MDDLLTSYISQMLSTMNKHKGTISFKRWLVLFWSRDRNAIAWRLVIGRKQANAIVSDRDYAGGTKSSSWGSTCSCVQNIELFGNWHNYPELVRFYSISRIKTGFMGNFPMLSDLPDLQMFSDVLKRVVLECQIEKSPIFNFLN